MLFVLKSGQSIGRALLSHLLPLNLICSFKLSFMDMFFFSS